MRLLHRNIAVIGFLLLPAIFAVAQRRPGTQIDNVKQLARSSGYIFSGTVLKVQRTTAGENAIAFTQVSFHVDQAIIENASLGGDILQDILMQSSATQEQEWFEPTSYSSPAPLPAGGSWAARLAEAATLIISFSPDRLTGLSPLKSLPWTNPAP